MKVSVVLIWLCLSSVQPRRLDDQLAVENTVQPDVWAELNELRNMVVKLKMLLQSSGNQTEGMMQLNADTPKVAFSFASGLHGYFGPVKSETILIFPRQITNVGNAYNIITGVFTAPVRGVYYFRFNLLGKSDKYWTRVRLFKNHESVIVSFTPPNPDNQYTVGGVTLELKEEDQVCLKLLTECEIYDDGNNHSTFSGFLIYPI